MAKKEKVKKINKTNLYLIISIIILGFFGGYFYWQNKELESSNLSLQTSDIFSQSDQEILKTTTPMAENFVQSFVAGDFIKSSQDFDNEMKININTQVLETVQGETLTKIGDLLDLGQIQISQKESNFIIVNYPEAEFTEEEKVSIRIVFKNDSEGNLKISGFGFDSPKLNSN